MRHLGTILLAATAMLSLTSCVVDDEEIDVVTEAGKKPPGSTPDAAPPPPPPGCPKTLDCHAVPPPSGQGWTLQSLYTSYCNGFLLCRWTRPAYPWGPITWMDTMISAPSGCRDCEQESGPIGPECATGPSGPVFLYGNQIWTCDVE